MKKLILIALLFLPLLCRSDFALQVTTNGVLATNGSPRSTNFFDANIVRLLTALSNSSPARLFIVDMSTNNPFVIIPRKTGSNWLLAGSAEIFEGAISTNLNHRGSLKIRPDGGTLAQIIFDDVWNFYSLTNTFALENVDTGDLLIRFEQGGNTVIPAPLVVSNDATIYGAITGNSVNANGGSLGAMTVVGTNNLNGTVLTLAGTYSSLVDSPGNNTAIDIGTNTVVEMSGSTQTANICSFAARDVGLEFKIIVSGATNVVIVNNSGAEGTTTRRITTGTGASLTLTNNPVWAKFRKRSAGYLLLEHSN